MSTTTTGNAYGIGTIAVIIGISASVIFYQMYYLPESLAKPSVDEHILHPIRETVIKIIEGSSSTEQTDNYIPKLVNIQLGVDNIVKWENVDSTGHTVTPDHRATDSYSGDFGSDGILKPGDTFEFVFTGEAEIEYHCDPHPWMTGKLIITKQRF